MFKKWMGLCVLMFLVLMAFALPSVAMANNIGGAPPGDIVAMIDMETVLSVVVSMEEKDAIYMPPANFENESEPVGKGSSLSPIACGNNVLLHGHPGGVSMALT